MPHVQSNLAQLSQSESQNAVADTATGVRIKFRKRERPSETEAAFFYNGSTGVNVAFDDEVGVGQNGF